MSKLNRISVPSVEMPNYWFQSSRMNHSTDRWKHTQHKVTPIIHYLFRDDGYPGTASHFNGDEPELLSRTDDIEKFATSWWNEIANNGGGHTNAGKYAADLHLEIKAAYMRVYKKHQQQFIDDFHNEFNPLLKFVNSKPVPATQAKETQSS